MRETLHLSWILPKPITSNPTHISTKVSRTHHDLPSPGQDDVVEDCDEGWWYSVSVFILQSFLKDGKYPSPVSTVLQPSPDPGLHTTCHSHDGLPSRQVSNLQLHITQNSRPLGVCRCVFLGKNGSTITAEPARFTSVLMQNCYCCTWPRTIKVCKRNDQTRIDNGCSRITNAYSKPSHTHDFLYSPMQTSQCYLLSYPDSALHCLHLHGPNSTTYVPRCPATFRFIMVPNVDEGIIEGGIDVRNTLDKDHTPDPLLDGDWVKHLRQTSKIMRLTLSA